MNNLETPTLSSKTAKMSTSSQPSGIIPDLSTKGVKEPLMRVEEEYPNNVKNKLAIQENEAPMAPRDAKSDSKIGQRVLAIRRADFTHTHEIASADFDTLQYDIMETFEMADLDG
jgi:hypothetical protein